MRISSSVRVFLDIGRERMREIFVESNYGAGAVAMPCGAGG